ncbi:MAG: hypothetical protein K2Y22_03955 [Candidatus Obscuribacterales bacterium]|nr:hypothetical protein [Candidatus Obscuribacterales bacterium]
MPPDNTSSLTIRIPDEHRKRLDEEANQLGRSLNQHMLRLIDAHFLQIGYSNNSLMLCGRPCEVRFELSEDNPHQTTYTFLVIDPKNDRTQAYFMIGLDHTFLSDLGVKDKHTVVKDVGLAVLSFHFRCGTEISTLRWDQVPQAHFLKRILSIDDVPKEAKTVQDFLNMLDTLKWTDRYAFPNHESEAIRTLLLAAMNGAVVNKDTSDGGSVECNGQIFHNPANPTLYFNLTQKMCIMELLELQPLKNGITNITYHITTKGKNYLSGLLSS